MPTATARAEDLLRELDQVWGTLGKQQSETGGVLRACAMTLVALVEDNANQIDVGETLAQLMHDHPSRAIVVRVGKENGSRLEGRAFAECWMPFGRRQQICCEQIEIQASLSSLGNVPAVLRGLLVPDLPVVLWVRSPNLLRQASVQEFIELAHKVIIESRAFDDWRWLMDQVKSLASQKKAAADLAWTRITRWRELISQVFEDPQFAAKAKSITHAVIRHSSPEPGPAATYLSEWLKQSIGDSCTVSFEASQVTKFWQIQQVELQGEGIHVSIQRTDKSVVDVQVNSLQTCSVFPTLKESDLLREELSIPCVDPVFEKVLG